jgi:hypothetical protein
MLIQKLDNMTETLQKIARNRDDNKKLLEQKKSLIIKQISSVKSKLCISQFTLEDGGILTPIDDKSITWCDFSDLNRWCDSVHSAHNFCSHSKQYFSACTVLLLELLLNNRK